jgi:UDP-glucose 4-epimerase
MKNILVTGGAGFIGSHTVVALVEAGFRPVIIDDFSNSERAVLRGLEEITGQSITCYDRNCNDYDLLLALLRQEQIDGVIHFAAFKAVGESMAKPLEYYDNNLGSLVALLRAQVDAGVPHHLFSSSCTVYGQPEQLPVTEETPVQPAMSVYGNTKQIGEEILRDAVAAKLPLNIISLRYFNPIGAHPSALIGELPRGVPGNLVPFITQTAAGLRPELTVFGDDYPTPDGTAIRDYIHVMDLAEAHVAALQYLLDGGAGPGYEVYNVGTGQGNSVLEIIRLFEDVSGRKLPYRIGPRRAGDITAVYADVTRVNRALGWTTKRSLRTALEDAWRWQQKLQKEAV